MEEAQKRSDIRHREIRPKSKDPGLSLLGANLNYAFNEPRNTTERQLIKQAVQQKFKREAIRLE